MNTPAIDKFEERLKPGGIQSTIMVAFSIAAFVISVLAFISKN